MSTFVHLLFVRVHVNLQEYAPLNQGFKHVITDDELLNYIRAMKKELILAIVLANAKERTTDSREILPWRHPTGGRKESLVYYRDSKLIFQ